MSKRVKIAINGRTHSILPRIVRGVEIRRMAKAYPLDVVEFLSTAGLVDITADAITICGGEQFVTHPGDGVGN